MPKPLALTTALLLMGCITDPPSPKVHNQVCTLSTVDSSGYVDSLGYVTFFHPCEFPEVKPNPPVPK